MKALWLDYKKIVGVLRKHAKRFIKYQVGTKILLVIILLPFFKSVFNLALKSKGMTYLTNGLITKFLMSPQGVSLVLFALFFGLAVVMIEMGGLIILSHQVLLGENESSFFQVMMHALRGMKRFIGLDGFFVVFYLLLIAPMMDSNIKSSILENLKIPGFVMDTIMANYVYLSILSIGFIVFFVLAMRWMFALHNILLGDEQDKHFLRKSSRLVAKNWRFILKHSLIVMLLNVLVLLGISFIFILGSAVIVLLFSAVALEPVLLLLFSVAVIGYFGVMFFFTPFQLIHMTMIYHQISEEEPRPLDLSGDRQDHIIDKLITSKKVLINVFIATIIGVSIFSMYVLEEIENVKYEVGVTAHRGSSKDAPENTLAALEVAVRNGATYAEIDVQETKDGDLVLLHDTNLKRTTGLDKAIWEATTEEVLALDAGAWFDETFKGEKVPTLEEVMVQSRNRLKLNIELKTNGHDEALAKTAVKLIQKHDYYKECVITSLDYEILQRVEALDPKIKTGYIMYVALGDLEALNVDFYSVEETNVNDTFVNTAHLIGREVHVWTINTKTSMNNMLDLGVDNIITDNDKMLSDLIKSKNSETW